MNLLQLFQNPPHFLLQKKKKKKIATYSNVLQKGQIE